MVRLRRVLRAAARTSAKTSGYVQGMNYLAGFLLCVYDGEHEDDEECAYWVLRCVTEDMFPGYFEPGLKTLEGDLEELDYRFSRASEEAHGKLQSMGLAVKFFTARWLMCGLVGCAAAPIVLRVWDLLFVDADRQPREALLRCSLAILALQAPFIRAAEDMNASVECIREAGSTIDNIEAYLQRVSDLRGRHFPSKPVGADRGDSVQKENAIRAAASDTRARCHDAGGEYSLRVPHLFLFTDAEQAVDRDAVDGTRLGTRTEKAVEFRRERGSASEVDEAQT